jgi:hypothetical protein
MGGIGKLYPAHAMLLKYLIYASLALIPIGCIASGGAAAPGFLEGHLKIRSPGPVDIGDENAPTVTPENYAEYPLLILSQSEKKEIARITANENGDYRVALPPGDYVLEVQSRPRKHLRWKMQPFTVVSNQTVRVDMDIIAVDQWRAGSMQPFRRD